MKIYNNTSGSTGRNISTSKGNQLKFCVGNKWYKADFLGFEGAAEYFVSELLKNSCIKNFVEYDITDIEYNGTKYNGCVSDDFLKNGSVLITAERLFKSHKNQSVESVINNQSLKEKIRTFVDEIEGITGLKDFGPYLTTLLELDRLTLNEDRHFRNIAVIKTIDGYDYCPVFDNGAAFLSDLREDYPLEKSIYGLIPKVTAKPFSHDFDKQVTVAQELYGKQLSIEDKDMSYAYSHIAEYYGEKIADRIRYVYEHQLYLLKDEIMAGNREQQEYDHFPSGEDDQEYGHFLPEEDDQEYDISTAIVHNDDEWEL